MSVDHAHVGHHAAVAVVDGVEDHGPRRGIRSADRGRDALDDAVEQLLDADARLARDLHHVVGRAADEVGELLRVLLGLGRRQVDLVEHRDDLEVVLEGEVEVREGLRLDALRRVDEQDRALARGERAGDLVAEVDVARGVDHVQRVRRVADLPGHAHRLALDGDAALALDVHAVEVLRPHVAVADDARDAEHAVGEGRLAVVDVRDDAEVADQRGVGGSGHRRIGGSRGHPDDSPMTSVPTFDGCRVAGAGATLEAP